MMVSPRRFRRGSTLAFPIATVALALPMAAVVGGSCFLQGRIVMRGFRLLFVAASIGALVVASFDGYATDRDAVTDLQAAQLAGGAGCVLYTSQACLFGCKGSCSIGAASTKGGTPGLASVSRNCGGNQEDSGCNNVIDISGCNKG
jgi:hypothetical protein